MRSADEVARVCGLASAGAGPSAIARITGIPRGTVRDWLAGRVPREPAVDPTRIDDLAAYSHLLGLYLGDGHIAQVNRTYQLRIFYDAKYPGLIGEGVRTVRAVARGHRVAVTRLAPTNCVVLRAYWNRWPALFPQHGPGLKHERAIELARWQSEITHAHPRELVRGLLNSDGSRFVNPVRHGGKLYEYSRYYFTNRSEDVKAILCEHLDLLGIAWRRVGDRHISVARRDAVAALDAFVGPKR